MNEQKTECQKDLKYTMKGYMNNPNIKGGAKFKLKSTPREKMRVDYGTGDNTYYIVKKYAHFVLCENIKTGFQESFSFWEMATRVRWI